MLYRSLLPLALSVSLMAVSGGLKQALAQPKKTPQVDPGAQQPSATSSRPSRLNSSPPAPSGTLRL